MFNIFKKTKQFTSNLDLHKEMEHKMTKLVAEEALQTLRVSAIQDIINNQINFGCYSDATLAKAAAQMLRATSIMIKATAALINSHKNGEPVAFEDKTIYTIINNAKRQVAMNSTVTTDSRDAMIHTIIDESKTLMSLERSMLYELVAYAKAENQAVTVRG